MAKQKIRKLRDEESSSEDLRRRRQQTNNLARARQWKRTGVSEATVRWMEQSGML